jgi:hypothetical protein
MCIMPRLGPELRYNLKPGRDSVIAMIQPPVTALAPKQASRPTRRLVTLGAVCLAVAALAVVRQQAGASMDDISPAEAQARAARLASFGPLPLQTVQPGEVKTAVEALGLPPAEHVALIADLDNSRTRLIWLTLYDSDVEDGDVAEIRSGGFSRTVPLTRRPIKVAVPVGPDGAILLTGSVDGGGGGVTVGVVLPSGPLPLPPLSVGQTLRLPVGPG